MSPAGFHAARVKFLRLSMVSPPNPAHQSPTMGSVRLATGNGEANAKAARPNSGGKWSSEYVEEPLVGKDVNL